MKTKVAVLFFVIFLSSLYICVSMLALLFDDSVNFIIVAKDLLPFALHVSGVFGLIFFILFFLKKFFPDLKKILS